jgi:pimeloyl-ACP methyl ester carboxylesterase
MRVEVLLAAGIAGGTVALWIMLWIAFTHARFHSYHRNAGHSYPALGFVGWASFYLRTVLSILRLSWWWIRGAFSDGLRLPSGERTGGPVLCIHGFHLTGGAMWGIRRTLEGRGRATRAVFLGIPYRSPEAYARSLAKAMWRLLEEMPGEQLDVVAHSMGGLILRLVLGQNPELAARIRRVVTLGSPHHGTAFLRWIRRGPVYRMMSLSAQFLQTLPTFEQTVPEAAVTTVATAHDLVVYPVESAHLAGARQVTLKGVGHVGLLTEDRVRERIADWLCEA